MRETSITQSKVRGDRKSVVLGNSEDLSGRRLITKNKNDVKIGTNSHERKSGARQIDTKLAKRESIEKKQTTIKQVA